MKLLKTYTLLFAIILAGCVGSSNTNNKTGNNSTTNREYTGERENRPNILIIFPDQLRRYSAGFWAKDKFKKYAIGETDPVVTPNIDRLAEQGVVVTNAISNFPLCSPFRGMFLSGSYPEQNGIWGNCKIGRAFSLKADIATIPDVFYEAGYDTSYFGKCHWLINKPLFDVNGNYQGTTDSPGGNYMNKYDTYVPPGADRHHIEYFYQSVKDQHFNPYVYSSNPNVIEGKKDGELYLPKKFSPKNEAENIITYLKNEKNERDAGKPFCMIWAINPPHQPWDDKNVEMDVLEANYGKDKYPKIDTTLVRRKNADLNVVDYARNYYSNVTSVDFYMGLVLDQLKKMGELDNTIVIFTSDHGEMLGSHKLTGKNVLKKEAYAVPFIVHWPKGLNPNVSEVLFDATDIFPTVLALAGLEDKTPSTVKGLNLSESIKNPDNNAEQHKSVLLMLGNARGIETNRYTLVLKENIPKADSKKIATKIEEMYYYDNQEDPYQNTKLQLNPNSDLSNFLLTELAKKLKLADDPWYKGRRYSNIIPY